MCLALSIYVLFISLMQSVNGAQFLNTAFLLALFGLPSACAAIGIVPLTSTYASHKIDFRIEV